MCRTPARVSRTMIQIANRKTAATMVFSPKPNRIISTGTMRRQRGAGEDIDPHAEQVVGYLDAPHQYAERHADHDRQSHADHEGAKGRDGRALPGRRLHEIDRRSQHVAEWRKQEDKVQPADDFPDDTPDEE